MSSQMPNGTTLSPMDMEMVDLGYPDQGYTPDHAYAPAPTPDVSPDGRIQQQRGTIPLADLPPMPTPDYATKRSESYVGIAVVLVIIAACLGGTYGAALATPDLPRGVLWLVLWLVSLEAVAAIGMLLGILFADPGTIKRSQETCFPIPGVSMCVLALLVWARTLVPGSPTPGQSTRPLEEA